MPKGAARIRKSFAIRSRRWTAWIASLTILVVAWAPLLGTLHQALVRHVVCEHGDLIEPDEQGHHEALILTTRDSSDSSSASIESGAGASSHDHTHCSMGTVGRSVATLSTRSMVGALLAEDRPVSLAARDANPVRSVLSSAPKTSPPAIVASSLS
jgi:hypothetical protein